MTAPALVHEKNGEEWRGLLRKAKAALAKGREIRISPERISRMQDQPRVFFSQGGIRLLADSIYEIGQITPGLVRRAPRGYKTDFALLDGERRWRACRMIGEDYRATLVKVDDEVVPFIIAAVANFNHENHTPTEVSDSIERLLKTGIPMPEISKLFGISLFWATQMHGLQNLAPRVRDLLDPNLSKERQLPITAAIQIAKANHKIQLGLARKVLERKIGLSMLRGEVIRASARAGTHIRLLTRGPAKRWDVMRNQSLKMARTMGDIETMVRDEEILKNMQNPSVTEMRKVSTALGAIAEKARWCKARVDSAM